MLIIFLKVSIFNIKRLSGSAAQSSAAQRLGGTEDRRHRGSTAQSSGTRLSGAEDYINRIIILTNLCKYDQKIKIIFIVISSMSLIMKLRQVKH
jgi:hypothetical protein